MELVSSHNPQDARERVVEVSKPRYGYEQFYRMHRAGRVLFSRVNAFFGPNVYGTLLGLRPTADR